jgi:hypothetical protein
MAEDLSREKVAKELVGILSKLLSCGDWNSSLFLRSASKRLQTLLDEAESLANQPHSAQFQAQTSKKIPTGYVPLYISLYQINGNNLKNWEYTLRLLIDHSINRPMYRDEQFARDLVGSKVDIDRHGYAMVYVKEEDIYQFPDPQKDLLGHELIVLKENVIKTNNIIGFVHANKDRYLFIDNNLVAE